LYNFYIFSLILTLLILPKELTLLDKLFFSVLACTVSSLFNELFIPRFSFGIAKVDIFSLLPNFFQIIFTLFNTQNSPQIHNSLNLRGL